MQKVAIHSVPRSGSTWLAEILNSSPYVKYCYQPLYSYQFKEFLDEFSSKEDVDKFFSMLVDTDDDYVCQKTQRNSGILPHVKKIHPPTHIIYKEVRFHNILKNLIRVDESLKFIFLVRDPVEVMNSWINAPKEFDPSWCLETELFSGELKNSGRKENFYGLDAWINTTRLFEYLANNYKKRVLLISYSMLQSNLRQILKEIYQFCDLPITDSTYGFLNESSKKKVLDTYSVFRGGTKSKITLDEEIVNKINTYVTSAKLAHYINSKI